MYKNIIESKVRQVQQLEMPDTTALTDKYIIHDFDSACAINEIFKSLKQNIYLL